VSLPGGPPADEVLAGVRRHLSDDLDAPGALDAVDEWVRGSLESGGTELGAPGLVGRALDALLGIRL
jgi:L-cysteine:1D-myo-inositol 2-amino-2-deoxy-alpha-D-glucopyranoside ligase